MNLLHDLIRSKLAGSGGGEAVLISKTITENGTYNASADSADGYKKVTVNVPNTYAAGDEGKVVSNGALVAQSSGSATQNGTVDTTLINSLTVNVGGYTLLASGSYTWAGGSSVIRIPVSYSGTPKMYGLIADEPLADTAQTICFCKLIDNDLFPEVFRCPDQNDGFVTAWGYRADNSIVHAKISVSHSALSESEMSCTATETTYPWRANTYSWYIWGVKA